MNSCLHYSWRSWEKKFENMRVPRLEIKAVNCG